MVNTAAVGSSSRGKYTFVTKETAPVTESVPEDSAAAKNSHGTNATNKKSGYGTLFWELTWRMREKTKLMISIWLNGLTNAQA